LPSFGAQAPHIGHILFQNTLGDFPFHHTGQLHNFYNLIAIIICGVLDFQYVSSLFNLLEDRPSSGDVPCSQLSRITIYTLGLEPENHWLGSKILVKELLGNPLKVVSRNPEKDFEVHLISEENEIAPLDI